MTSASTTALATRSLSRAFGSRLAVDALDLEVRRGEVFGFLGPNGAGKTTTIRMLLGLLRPTSGRVEILGQDLNAAGAGVLSKVGALIESPALYPFLSGWDNLKCFGDLLGGVPACHLDELLDLVGLAERERDRVRSYSLGMRQRLAIAVALLHNPELIVLDEPANGLDPAGVVEIRHLMRRLAEVGRTVFVSSHVLVEVQESCDRIAIISRGRLVMLAAVDDLVGASGEFEVALDDPVGALSSVSRTEWGATARIENRVLVTPSPTGRGRDLIEFLECNGARPDSVSQRRRTLEEVFLHLTRGDD